MFIEHNKPGEEAISQRHTGGSYIEIDKNSSIRQTSVGKAYYYMADGFTQTVDGHSDVKVLGSHSFIADSVKDEIKNNKHVGVGGSFTEAVHGEFTSYVGKNRWLAVDGKDTQRVKGKANYSYGDDSVLKYEKNLVEIVNKNATTRVGGSMEIITTESVDTEATQGSETPGLIRIVCKNLEIEAESITLKTPQGLIKIDANILQQTNGNFTTTVNGNSNTVVDNNIFISSKASNTVTVNKFEVTANPIKLNG